MVRICVICIKWSIGGVGHWGRLSQHKVVQYNGSQTVILFQPIRKSTKVQKYKVKYIWVWACRLSSYKEAQTGILFQAIKAKLGRHRPISYTLLQSTLDASYLNVKHSPFQENNHSLFKENWRLAGRCMKLEMDCQACSLNVSTVNITSIKNTCWHLHRIKSSKVTVPRKQLNQNFSTNTLLKI